jgi:2-C-methyl-D-erythritol 2,4-cyclodiphosphate synthase
MLIPIYKTPVGEQVMRIGHGYDVHRFASDTVAQAATAGEISGGESGVVLGGVEIPYSRKLLAHSDGDVLIHAICDALLGAICAADIGQHFPDTDPDNADIDSRILLRKVVAKLHAAGWCVSNLDSTLVAQAPKMAPHITAMRTVLATDMGVEVGCVNVKATTTENLGFTGRGEGIAAHAVVLLKRLQQ